MSPKQRPGAFSILGGTPGTFAILDADTKTSLGPLNLPASTTNNPYPTLQVFSALGTYKLNLTVGATHNTAGELTDTGTYTFHVGPISELEVRDTGPSPAVGADRRAYTIMAMNNGPDIAPAVEVTLTGVPEDAEAVASHGSYDPAIGVWTIGRMNAGGDQRASGHAEEGPTLTLITAGGAPITATIENTQDYCVRIQTADPDPDNDLECAGSVQTGYTEHSIAYYDHIEGNNTAQIIPWPGIGDGHPDAPASLTATGSSLGHILQWQPVDKVNRYEVVRYEIQRFDLLGARWERVGEARGTIYLDEGAPGFSEYRVRAVNIFGVGGPWSRPARTDAPHPTVDEVSIVSTPVAGDAYGEGETIALEVAFSERVRVTGTPTLALEVGDATRQLPMASHSRDTLTFRYVVGVGDTDTDGVSVPENGLTGGASIKSRSSGKVALLGFPALDDQHGHKVSTMAPPEPETPFYVEPLPAPQALIATPGDGEVLLQWGAYCCDRKDIFYQLWRADFPTWRDIEGSDQYTSEHTVTGLENEETYRFQVRAVYRHKADDGTATEYPGAPSRTVAATPYDPTPTPGTTPTPNNPPVFERPDDEDFSVVERAPMGTEVARVRATDPDGHALTYTLSGENAAKFSIANDANDKNVGVIMVAEEELSYTWEPGGTSFSIGVEVTDNRGGRDNRIVGVRVTASDLRNNAPVAEDPEEELYVACGAAVGTEVHTIIAEDPEGDPLWYILVDGADYFRFKGGGVQEDLADSIWSDDHAVLVTDGSAVLEVTGEPNTTPLSGDICGRLIWVIIEIEEQDNPANNDTLQFQVRVGPSS